MTSVRNASIQKMMRDSCMYTCSLRAMQLLHEYCTIEGNETYTDFTYMYTCIFMLLIAMAQLADVTSPGLYKRTCIYIRVSAAALTASQLPQSYRKIAIYR